MAEINKLTPEIKGKAFDPDWFLIRQRFEQIEAERNALKSALLGWRKYFQSDIPKTADDQEQMGEDFTQAWMEMDKALGITTEHCGPRVRDCGDYSE